ncbi:DEAD/DEAH box helicase domain-containing protein [Halopenitus malekzadehii]|uniref:DEAD/DEAH box helicase domain-containing protein n=1 Tax=Halopenitus malekzadehii TaxID=1267564 RepID=A0A1H6J699_9EURY|nr:DEAD/DEAH box helicase [Halopenitus malekzadehii]SEH56254.1 DEAD/DEAH box helicase domain-containing protein [Halopenitus malekzadehii]
MSSDPDPPEYAPITARGLERTFPQYEGQLQHAESVSAQAGAYVDPHEVLGAGLADSISESVGDLYTHQASALRHLADGDDVCVATSTSSGKTYVYALQIARNYLADPDSTALLVYPTKALSRDQEQELNEFFSTLGLNISVRVYDGDTPQNRRKQIRETADVIITNFVGINVYLAHHTRWHTFWANCDLLAIDESHTYTGVHGMHVAWTIRRLRRILEHYDSDPQIVCTSATIGNPSEHSRRLTGKSFTVVDEDGSPRGKRDIAFWKPPVDDGLLGPDADFEEFQQAQTNPVREASSVLAHLGLNGTQTLMFTRSRKNAELGAKYASNAASSHPNSGYLSVEPYHAGLGKETRRGTEYQFKSEQLDGVTSTNALELGIDIGSMDATILTGYPGTRQSFWQQIGRSGRGDSDALSVFVARADAIDQYILDDPAYVLGDAIEDAVIGLENNPVYAQHILCAAQEHPLTAADREWFDGDRLDRAVEMWIDAGKLAGDLSRSVRYTGSPRPQSDISMYTSSDIQFDVRCQDRDIDMEPIDRERAYRDHHEGALFLHNGVQYEVVDFVEDVPNPSITVEEVRTNEYTETISEKTVRNIDPEATRELGNGYQLSWGTGTVEIHYTHFRRKDINSGSATQPLRPTGLPPIELNTQLMWIETPPSLQDDVLREITGEDSSTLTDSDVMEVFGGGLHGAEHGMIKLTPLELRMDKSDLGGLSTIAHPETGVPTWFIHDAVEGGLGFTKRIFDQTATIAERTRERVSQCDCNGTSGCPACIMDSQCGNQNRFLHTDATLLVLDNLINQL